jgi:xanthine dehydrogenase accessory factor
MPGRDQADFLDAYRQPFAVVLGTGEIASAVSVYLHRAGFATILSHDAFPPVIRRAMSFHDALFDERTLVEEIEAERASDAMGLLRVLAKPSRVAVTTLGLVDLIAIRTPQVLVDARMQKHRISHDLRVVPLAVGLGPNFEVGVNCDIAIETRPGRNGRLVTVGGTDAADGIASPLGGVGRERFVYSEHTGVWHTPIEIGTRVYKGFLIGRLGDQPVHAPIDGVLRGVVRDGARVPGGVKLIEIDPRGRNARWTGIDDRSRSIAIATMKAIRLKQALPAQTARAMGADSLRVIDFEA